MTSCDLLIVGSGICALSIAFEALQAGLKVQLIGIDKKGASTPAAGGMLAPAAEAAEAETDLISWGLASTKLYPNWIKNIEAISQIKVDLNTNGSLLLALTRDHLSDLKHLESFHSSNGLNAVRLSISETRKLEPMITPKMAGSLWVKTDNSVNPIKLQQSLLVAIQKMGCQIHRAKQVQLSVKDGICHGASLIDSSTNILILSDKTVVADGIWSKDQADLLNLPLRAVKGQYIRLKGNPIISRTIRTPDVYLIPRSNGELYIGASMDEEGRNPRLRAGATLDGLYHAYQAIRAIYELDILDIGMGYRPALRDNNPAVGPTPIDNLYLNVGHYRHGILLAPIAAKELLRNMTGEDKVSRFSPLRLWS